MNEINTEKISYQQKAILKAIKNTLEKETHNLVNAPEILWQQLSSRLQWDTGPIQPFLHTEKQKRIEEGRLIWGQSFSRIRESAALLRTLSSHKQAIRTCAISPDGKWIASGSSDGEIKIWDLEKGKVIKTLIGHDNIVSRCVFSPGAKWILSASQDKTLKIWDLASGSEIKTLIGHQLGVFDCEISLDGKWIVSLGGEQVYKIWETATGEERYNVKAGSQPRDNTPPPALPAEVKRPLEILKTRKSIDQNSALSSNGKWLLRSKQDGSLDILDVANFKMLHSISANAAFFKNMSGMLLPGSFKSRASGYSHRITACAINAEGTLTFSASSRQYSGKGVSDTRLVVHDAFSGEELAVFSGHSDEITSFALSPDDRLLISASQDGTLKVWDLSALKSRLLTQQTLSSVTDCTFSPDGKWVLFSTQKGSLTLMDAKNGNLIKNYLGHKAAVNACAISPDSKWFVSACADGSLIIWELSTGKILLNIQGHSRAVRCVAISPDGKWILSGSEDHTIGLWDAASGLRKISPNGLPWNQGPVTACAISPDGTQIAASCLNEVTNIFDAASGAMLHNLDAGMDKNAASLACSYSPDGTHLVCATRDHMLVVLDAASGKEQAFLRGHKSHVSHAAFSPDGEWLVSASHDGTLKIWNITSGEALLTLSGHTGPVSACTVSPDGEKIVSAGTDGRIKIWNTITGQNLQAMFGGHESKLSYVGFSPDGKQVISAAEDKMIKFWDAESFRERKVFKGNNTDLAFLVSQDGSLALSSGKNDVNFCVLDLKQASERIKLGGHSDRFSCFAISPDSTWFISAGADRRLKLWDANSGNELHSFHQTSRVNDCKISPDGTFIVSAGADGSLFLWDIASKDKRFSLSAHSKPITHCEISPDGNWILSASEDHTLKIWNAADGKLIRTLDGHSGLVLNCRISPDLTWLVSSSKDGTLKVWNPAQETPLLSLPCPTAYAISPNGTWLCVCKEKVLLVINPFSGERFLNIPISGFQNHIAWHPWLPLVLCGDDIGNINLFEFFNLPNFPALLTAVKKEEHLEIRCPACQQVQQVSLTDLGSPFICPSCGLKSKLNEFFQSEPIKWFESEKQATEIQKMIEMAEQGELEMKYKLGLIYNERIYPSIVSQDPLQAANWYRKAALSGHVKAQFELGQCYRTGYGVPINEEKAIFWYSKASKAGDEEASKMLKNLRDQVARKQITLPPATVIIRKK